MYKFFTIAFLLIFLNISSISPVKAHKREVRATWLTTAYRLDWPQTRINTPKDIATQQKELTQILDQLQSININTILFQIRHKGSTIYPSKIEPSNQILTNNSNNNSFYDPLAFIVKECHNRGMECHAWLVTIPADDFTPKNVIKYPNSKRHIIKYKGKQYLDPSHPDTKLYLASVVSEVITQYDVDGIHLDYLRYPERMPDFPDKARYNRSKSRLSIDDWRRDNITAILKEIHKEVKQHKPWVKVSISPIGKHSDTNRYSAKGWSAYDEVKQDVYRWMQLGIVDQIYPMIYFQANNFYPFALDWNEQKRNSHIVAGLGIYFLEDEVRTWSIEEVQRQILFTKENKLDGQAYFRTEHLLKDSKGVMSSLQKEHYRHPALIPAMPWINNIIPSQPTYIKLVLEADKAELSWGKSSDDDSNNSPKYNIYFSKTYPVDTNDAANLLRTYLETTQYTREATIPYEHYGYYAITAIDRYGNESEAIQLRPKQDIEIR